MTKTEMNRRLATLTPELIETVMAMIDQGFGAQGIANETTATLKQINACFALRAWAFAK